MLRMTTTLDIGINDNRNFRIITLISAIVIGYILLSYSMALFAFISPNPELRWDTSITGFDSEMYSPGDTVTLDGYLEEAVSHLADNGFVVQARVLDAIGSDAAEQVAEHVRDVITEGARAQGLSTSQRFSPGYCDWEVDQQRILFRAMNGSSAFIELTDKCLMIPRKSISGIIGIGTFESGVESYNPCKTCCQRDCPGRR